MGRHPRAPSHRPPFGGWRGDPEVPSVLCCLAQQGPGGHTPSWSRAGLVPFPAASAPGNEASGADSTLPRVGRGGAGAGSQHTPFSLFDALLPGGLSPWGAWSKGGPHRGPSGPQGDWFQDPGTPGCSGPSRKMGCFHGKGLGAQATEAAPQALHAQGTVLGGGKRRVRLLELSGIASG